MTPPAWERGSQGVENRRPVVKQKEAPGVKFRSPGGQISPPGESQMGFRSPLGRLGRQVGLRRALWAEKGDLENCMDGSWDRL